MDRQRRRAHQRDLQPPRAQPVRGRQRRRRARPARRRDGLSADRARPDRGREPAAGAVGAVQADALEQCGGYDPDFLSRRNPARRDIYAKLLAAGKVAPLLDGSHELDYFHFSSVMHAERRFPLLTAVNIDGLKRSSRSCARTTGGPIRGSTGSSSPTTSSIVEDKGRRGSTSAAATWSACSTRAGAMRRRRPPRPPTASAGCRTRFTSPTPRRRSRPTTTSTGATSRTTCSTARRSARSGMTVFTGPIYRDNDPTLRQQAQGRAVADPAVVLEDRGAAEDRHHDRRRGVHQRPDRLREGALRGQDLLRASSPTRSTRCARARSRPRSRRSRTTGLDFSALLPFDAQGSLEATRQTAGSATSTMS